MKEIKLKVMNEKPYINVEDTKRDIKFRLFNFKSCSFEYFDIIELLLHKFNLSYSFTKYSKISRYTGIKDKNGKEIYEGDILMDSDKKICSVFFDEYEAKFDTYKLEKFTKGNSESYYEIIGNIYDNSELISK